MQVGVYHSQTYFVISKLGETVELSPTQHGAGSFFAHQDFVKIIEAFDRFGKLTERQFDVVQDILARNSRG